MVVNRAAHDFGMGLPTGPAYCMPARSAPSRKRTEVNGDIKARTPSIRQPVRYSGSRRFFLRLRFRARAAFTLRFSPGFR
jgi:hypothetical protein